MELDKLKSASMATEELRSASVESDEHKSASTESDKPTSASIECDEIKSISMMSDDSVDGFLPEGLLGGINLCTTYLRGRHTPTKRAPISERGELIRDSLSDMAAHLKMAQAKGVYHPQNNTKGVLDLGSSVNVFSQEAILEKMDCPEMNIAKSMVTEFTSFMGSDSLRVAMADFLAKYFNSSFPINPRSLMVTGGVQASLDLLVTMLSDPGDGCLVFTPCCSFTFSNLSKRTGVEIVHCPLQKISDKTSTFAIDLKEVEETIKKSQRRGIRMRIAILDNPKNPTGDVLSEPELVQLINIFHKNNMHLIVDEFHALSTLPSHPFTSVLSIRDIPDPHMVHFVWGFPEDFARSGVTCGVVHTLIPQFADMCFEFMPSIAAPATTQDKLTLLLQDEVWLERYITENIQHICESYRLFKTELECLGIEIDVNSGHFIWVDFSEFMPSLTKEDELALFEQLLTAGVFIRPGTSLLCEEPGWFRITFTNSRDVNEMGLERLVNVLMCRRNELEH